MTRDPGALAAARRPVIPIAEEPSVGLYRAERKIHPREIRGRFSQWRWIVVALGAQTLLVTAGLEALLAAPLERLAARHPLKEGHPVVELAALSDWLTVRAAEERSRKRAEKAERRVEAAPAAEEQKRS